MAKRTTKKVTVGQLINKLERNIAIANMNGDLQAAERFRQMLQQAASGTQFPEFVA
jgi:hypothetical protein